MSNSLCQKDPFRRWPEFTVTNHTLRNTLFAYLGLIHFFLENKKKRKKEKYKKEKERTKEEKRRKKKKEERGKKEKIRKSKKRQRSLRHSQGEYHGGVQQAAAQILPCHL